MYRGETGKDSTRRPARNLFGETLKISLHIGYQFEPEHRQVYSCGNELKKVDQLFQ